MNIKENFSQNFLENVCINSHVGFSVTIPLPNEPRELSNETRHQKPSLSAPFIVAAKVALDS